MVIDLTAGIVVGLAIGWGLDELFGSKPVFMVAFTLLGFAAGVRVMLQSAQRANDAARAADGTGAGGETAAPKTEDGAAAPSNEGR